MKLEILKPFKALNAAYRKASLKREQIELFKANLQTLFSHCDNAEKGKESEEHFKNLVSDFLKETYYKDNHFVNTANRKDLVIHNDKTSTSKIGVIVEVKRPSNKTEMISLEKPNAKALHELIHYYLQERSSNKEIKHLIVTNIYEWYIFDATEFEHAFFDNKELRKEYNEWQNHSSIDNSTDGLYKKYIQPYLDKLDKISCAYFNLNEIKNLDKANEKTLINLYKILSSEHLLKKPFANDSNLLNKEFYNELLHLIGLEETKDGGKKIIDRKTENDRNDGSLLENTINIIKVKNKIADLKNLEQFGETQEKQLFSVALELCITWLNRILFLKLLEGQLIQYHKGDRKYAFLNIECVKDFDELNELFFEVLAIPTKNRTKSVNQKFENLPYLNSSLFDESELEKEVFDISALKDRLDIPVFGHSVLKDAAGKKTSGYKNTLQYLFEFLDAYDFSSDGNAEIQEQSKTIINASVLGLIFEKINGYKDGSFYTPGFITMYMCRETLRKAVIQKFNQQYDWKCETWEELYNKTEKISIVEANSVVNSLKICDPAVGSGHFLVSALNEIISIKNDLEILADSEGKRLKGYSVQIENDELIVTNEEEAFEYNYKDKESQRVQETLFREKQIIIENCLFGVDINPKSAMICRLRLWIELLKNTYYTKESDLKELETLPNIDINIKHGNSLISRFALSDDVFEKIPNFIKKLEDYKFWVGEYKTTNDKKLKEQLRKQIDVFKNDFKKRDPRLVKLNQQAVKIEFEYNTFGGTMFDNLTPEHEKRKKKLEEELNKLVTERRELESSAVYENAFEWRYEFPEVLNDKGNFIGFDVIIGNPPYVQLQKNGGALAKQLEKAGYKTFERTGDIYSLFYEKGTELLKPKGYLGFITSNKWMRAGYGESTRKFLAENTNPILLIDFAGQSIFDEATVDTNILLLSKEMNQQKTLASVVKDKVLNNMSDLISQSVVECNFSSSESWTILSPIEQSIKTKIEAIGKPLRDWDINIYRGILTGYNEAFIIDGRKKDELIAEDSKSAEIIRPILRGKDVKRYSYDFADKWLINVHNGVKEIGIKPININDYPAIKKHLDLFYPELEKRTDKGDTPYNLRNCAYMEDFSKQKIIWKIIGNQMAFSIDSNKFIVNNACYILTGSGLEYLLSILNSNIIKWYSFVTNMNKTGVGDVQVGGQNVNLFPIPLLPEIEQKPFTELVKKIASEKEENRKTEDIEKRIENLVSELYGLTKEESDFIESQ